MHLVLVLSILGIQEPVQTTFRFARDLQSALEEARDRHVPLLFCNFDTWRMELLPNTNGHPLKPVLADTDLARVVKKTVCVLSSTEKHGDTKQIIDGDERTVCKAFGWTPCSTHKVALDHVFKNLAQGGVLEFPHFYLVDFDGKVLVSLIGEKGAATLASELETAISETKPGLDPALYARARAAFAEATAAERAGDFYTARTTLESIGKLAKGYPPEDKALSAMVRMNDSARQHKNEIVAALQKGQGNALDQVIALDDLAFAMGELATGLQAKNALDEFLQRSEFANLQSSLEQHRAARNLYMRSVDLVKEGKRDPARRSLTDLLKRFAGSRFDDRARKLMDDLLRKPKKP